MAKKNAFDEMLESMSNEGHRKALAEIAETNPGFRDSFLRQSDYSRQMDEHRETLQFAEKMQAWYGEHWIPNAFGEGKGGTKREVEINRQYLDAQKKVDELSQKISVEGGEVTFKELESQLNQTVQSMGLAKQEDVKRMLDEKSSGVTEFVKNSLDGFAEVALKGPSLVLKHYRDFPGEELDLNAIVTHANEHGLRDLTSAYDSFVAPKRREIETKRHQEEIAAAKQSGREEALKERGMSPTSMPDDSSGSTMGPMQRRILGVQVGADGKPDLSKAEMGRGTLAAHAARNWDQQ